MCVFVCGSLLKDSKKKIIKLKINKHNGTTNILVACTIELSRKILFELHVIFNGDCKNNVSFSQLFCVLVTSLYNL